MTAPRSAVLRARAGVRDRSATRWAGTSLCRAGPAVTVRLYLSNRCDCTNVPGSRVFDVLVDGVTRLDDWDLVARYGDQVGAMESFDIVSDGNVDIDFGARDREPAHQRDRDHPHGHGRRRRWRDHGRRRRPASLPHRGSTVGANEVLAGTAAWSLDRGAFLVDGTLYTGWADGTFSRRSFNGTTFGAPTTDPDVWRLVRQRGLQPDRDRLRAGPDLLHALRRRRAASGAGSARRATWSARRRFEAGGDVGDAGPCPCAGHVPVRDVAVRGRPCDR